MKALHYDKSHIDVNADSKVHGAHLGPDRTQMGPMLAPWTLQYGKCNILRIYNFCQISSFHDKVNLLYKIWL